MMLGKLRKLIGLVANQDKDEAWTSRINMIKRVELFLSGSLASMATQTYNESDLSILKVVLYMRGVQGALMLTRLLIEKLINFMRRKYNDNSLSHLFNNKDKATDKSINEAHPIKFTVPHSNFILPALCITITVWCMHYENYAVPKSINSRIEDVFQIQKGEF